MSSFPLHDSQFSVYIFRNTRQLSSNIGNIFGRATLVRVVRFCTCRNKGWKRLSQTDGDMEVDGQEVYRGEKGKAGETRERKEPAPE